MEEKHEIQPYEDEEEIDLSPFFEYLQSEKGHDLASRIVRIIEDLKKHGITKSTEQWKYGKLYQGLMITVVLCAVVYLTVIGKFDSTVGVIFGTIIGYLFGKKA
ncbi:MAG: hypothetical protein H8E14_07435 [Candidatus Marinimicrobia bacterium]|nr:hypothetical protein [Candidatus Neomarinimicrobiota bacterium]